MVDNSKENCALTANCLGISRQVYKDWTEVCIVLVKHENTREVIALQSVACGLTSFSTEVTIETRSLSVGNLSL